MNKFYIFIACAIMALLSSCDETFNVTTMSYEDISGTWYEPEWNEEVKFTESGRFYDHYSNVKRAGSVEGTYEISANKLTRRYTFLGQVREFNVTLADVIDGRQFTMKSRNVGNFTVYKVEETINMQPGETKTLPCSVNGSPDERIVAVDGQTATAAGLKGTVYLKTRNDTYIKVVVGEEVNDLWYDYTSVLGLSLAEIKAKLGEPDEMLDGSAYYEGMNVTHDMLSYVCIAFKGEKAFQVQLKMKDAVDDEDVKSYMSSKYYYDSLISSADVLYYLSQKTFAESQFVSGYYPKTKRVLFEMRMATPQVPDYTYCFKKNKEALGKEDLFKDAEILLQGPDSVRYALKNEFGFDYATFYFRGKGGGLMNSFAIHHTSAATSEDIAEQLSEQYKYNGEQTVNGYIAKIYLSADYSLAVYYYPSRQRIEFYDFTQEEEQDDAWEDFTSCLGSSLEEMQAKYPNGYYDRNTLTWLIDDNKYVYYCMFVFENNVATKYFFGLKDTADIDEMKTILSGKYHLLGDNAEKKVTMWINDTDRDKATLGVQLEVNSKTLGYFKLK